MTKRPTETIDTTWLDDTLLVREAFSDAWRQLLAEERVTARNVLSVPDVLLEAILEAAERGERDEQKLVAAAMRRMTLFERDDPSPVGADGDLETVH
jgi:hypothetical protein